MPVAVQANCAPCLALSESVFQRPHDGFGLELRTPAKFLSVESCILQGLFTAHPGCFAIPINCLVDATDCIKTHQRSEGMSGSRRRRETRAEVQLHFLKDAYNKDAYDATLPQGIKRDSPRRTRESRQLPARSCLQESCGLLGCRMYTQVSNTRAALSQLKPRFGAYSTDSESTAFGILCGNGNFGGTAQIGSR